MWDYIFILQFGMTVCLRIYTAQDRDSINTLIFLWYFFVDKVHKDTDWCKNLDKQTVKEHIRLFILWKDLVFAKKDHDVLL